MVFNIDKIRPLIRYSKRIFTPMALCFFCYVAWHSRNYVVDLFGATQHSWILISISLWMCLHFVSPAFTQSLLASFSLQLKYKDAFTIHNNHLPAKYIPGGIWHSVARSGDYYNRGISARHVAAYLLIENIIIASVTLALGGIIVANIGVTNSLFTSLILTCSVILIVANILLPKIISIKLFPRNKSLDIIKYLISIFIIFIYWIIAGISFICYLLSFPSLGINVSMFEVAGIYLFSWGVGFITLFAPQGIGISEVVTIQLLGADLDSSSSIIIVIAGFRIIVLIADMLTWITSVVFKSLSATSSHPL
jgi:hypothetical protein